MNHSKNFVCTGRGSCPGCERKDSMLVVVLLVLCAAVPFAAMFGLFNGAYPFIK